MKNQLTVLFLLTYAGGRVDNPSPKQSLFVCPVPNRPPAQTEKASSGASKRQPRQLARGFGNPKRSAADGFQLTSMTCGVALAYRQFLQSVAERLGDGPCVRLGATGSGLRLKSPGCTPDFLVTGQISWLRPRFPGNTPDLLAALQIFWPHSRSSGWTYEFSGGAPKSAGWASNRLVGPQERPATLRISEVES
jgi:hypothetical protein